MANNQITVHLSLEITDAFDLSEAIEHASKIGYSSVTTPVVATQFIRDFQDKELMEKQKQVTKSELILSSGQWMNKVICRISDYVDCESELDWQRKNSEETVRQEMAFADHLVQNGYTIMKLKSADCVNTSSVLLPKPQKHAACRNTID
jgi:protein arginine N-methyltransferase 5